ncbi:MAG TPA: hypothetical protein VGD80_15430 [Kofleriaceae bacterium]
MLARLLLVALVLHAGCFAPQRSGGARTAYLTMATGDAALVGGLGGLLGCSFLTGEIWEHGGKASNVATVCGLGGMVAGGGGALYGSLNSDDEPDTATWVVVSLPAAIAGVSLVIGSVAWIVDRLRR